MAVFLAVLLTTAMLYFYITRRLRREQCDTVPDPCRPAVAITFDDGPDPEYTPRILDILHQHNAPDTFFLVGENLSENKLLVK